MAFNHCHGLRRVTLGNGLVVIDEYAFSYCKLIEVIIISNAVREIKVGAFCGCRGLTKVILGEGLEEIGMDAFRECTSMVEIVIPSAVRDIDDAAYLGCKNLKRVKFCDEIEEFVSSDAMRVWWNQGRHKKLLCTYRFLVRCRIPVRLVGLAPVSSWQANINTSDRRSESLSLNLDQIFVCVSVSVSVPPQITLGALFIMLLVRRILSNC
jgi:hypothetical protein